MDGPRLLELDPRELLASPLCGCSMMAQWFWFRLQLLMHTSERYGYLAVNGLPFPLQLLARQTGCTNARQAKALLRELVNVGALQKTSGGVIYDRELLRREREREKDREKWKNDKRRARGSGVRPPDVHRMSTVDKRWTGFSTGRKGSPPLVLSPSQKTKTTQPPPLPPPVKGGGE